MEASASVPVQVQTLALIFNANFAAPTGESDPFAAFGSSDGGTVGGDPFSSDPFAAFAPAPVCAPPSAEKGARAPAGGATGGGTGGGKDPFGDAFDGFDDKSAFATAPKVTAGGATAISELHFPDAFIASSSASASASASTEIGLSGRERGLSAPVSLEEDLEAMGERAQRSALADGRAATARVLSHWMLHHAATADPATARGGSGDRAMSTWVGLFGPLPSLWRKAAAAEARRLRGLPWTGDEQVLALGLTLMGDGGDTDEEAFSPAWTVDQIELEALHEDVLLGHPLGVRPTPTGDLLSPQKTLNKTDIPAALSLFPLLSDEETSVCGPYICLSGSCDLVTVLGRVVTDSAALAVRLDITVINSSGFKIPYFTMQVLTHSEGGDIQLQTANGRPATAQGEENMLPHSLVKRSFYFALTSAEEREDIDYGHGQGQGTVPFPPAMELVTRILFLLPDRPSVFTCSFEHVEGVDSSNER